MQYCRLSQQQPSFLFCLFTWDWGWANSGQVWYGLTEGADFQEVSYQVVKLQGLCLVQNSHLHRWLLGCEGCVSSPSGISDVCPECGVAPHSVEHLFNCQSNPTQLTAQDLWDNLAAVADFLNLGNWRKEKSRRAITTTTWANSRESVLCCV